MEKKKRRYFPDEFKRQAAERVETSGLSIMDVAAELGVHETQLRRWIRQFGKSGTGRPGSGERAVETGASEGPDGARYPKKKAALIFGAATR